MMDDKKIEEAQLQMMRALIDLHYDEVEKVGIDKALPNTLAAFVKAMTELVYSVTESLMRDQMVEGDEKQRLKEMIAERITHQVTNGEFKMSKAIARTTRVGDDKA
jgi:hypothetical protein